MPDSGRSLQDGGHLGDILGAHLHKSASPSPGNTQDRRPACEPLAADIDEVRAFMRVVFSGIKTGRGHIALRSFPNGNKGAPDIRWHPFGQGLASAATAFATEVANRTGDEAAVFAPPVCVFGDLSWKGKRRAAEDNVIACRVIALELDENPQAMLQKASSIVGEPTLLIQSGGVWSGPNGPEDKLHAYWRLTEAATTPEDLARLKKVRQGLTRLCGGDGTAPPVCHPMRWPGSFHTKAGPRLCKIIRETKTEISLADAEGCIVWAADIQGVDLSHVAGPRRPRGSGFKTPVALGETQLEALASAIANPLDLSWDDWSHVGMAFLDGSHASAEGLAAFDRWSAKNDAKYDPDAVEERWSHWQRSPPDDLSAGTLFFLAKRDSPQVAIPMQEPVDVSAVWEPVEGSAGEGDKAAADAPADADAPDYVQRLNRTHALVMNNGQSAILNQDEHGKVTFSNRRSFEDRYANDTVMVDKRVQSVATLWMKDPSRRFYVKGVEFAPGGVQPGVFNLWPDFKPFGGPAAPGGSCQLILAHIRNIICDGNEEANRYLVGWLAHMVQRPEEKPEVCVVLQGKKGTGKDTLGYYLDAMMPGLRFGVSQQEQVTGRFNGHLAAVLLLHVEEAIWAGSKSAESALKSLITSPTLSVEYKGLTPFIVKSVLRVLMTSNEDWVVPATEDERRFFVTRVSEAKRRNGPYFEAIARERDNGGGVALLAYLRAVDLSKFDVRAVPNTAGLLGQKTASLRNFDLWWFEQIQAGTYWGEDGTATPIERDLFYAAYRTWLDKQRYESGAWNKERVGRRLREMLPEGWDIDIRPRAVGGQGRRTRAYRLPNLMICQRKWSEMYGASDDF